MSIWQKIIAGTKFLFGGFDSATDYLLNVVLNPYLSVDTVAVKVHKTYTVALSVYERLAEYAIYCPQCWRKFYDAVLIALDSMVDTLADGVVSKDELTNIVNAVVSARDVWNED